MSFGDKCIHCGAPCDTILCDEHMKSRRCSGEHVEGRWLNLGMIYPTDEWWTVLNPDGELFYGIFRSTKCDAIFRATQALRGGFGSAIYRCAPKWGEMRKLGFRLKKVMILDYKKKGD